MLGGKAGEREQVQGESADNDGQRLTECWWWMLAIVEDGEKRRKGRKSSRIRSQKNPKSLDRSRIWEPAMILIEKGTKTDSSFE